MTTDIVPYADLSRMATSIAKSGLFGIRTPDQALALMLISQAEGRHPALAARDYDIIQGRPAKKAEAMLRDFLQSGGKVEWLELSDTYAKAKFSHPQGGTVTLDWDQSRAERAGLLSKDNYKKFPRQMLRARCISEGVRTVYPLATSGMYVPEEVHDQGPTDTFDGTTIDATVTAETLDKFASEEPTTSTGEPWPNQADNRFYREPEPEPDEPLLTKARRHAMQGTLVFRDYWVSLDQAQRNEIREHLGSLEHAAKKADQPQFATDPDA